MGTVFGSFLTLATYRIPLNQDITHKRSYCPNCHHKLGFWDLIPLFSYIFLGAKCRYCKKKISPRYFIIELLTGISFVILAKMLNMNIYYLDFVTIMEFIFGVLYIIFLFLMAGIDLEHKKIDNTEELSTENINLWNFNCYCKNCISIYYVYIQWSTL